MKSLIHSSWGGGQDFLFILFYWGDLKIQLTPAVLCDVGSPLHEERLALAKQCTTSQEARPGACSPEKAGPALEMILCVCLQGEPFMRPLFLCSMVSGLLPLGSVKVDVRGPHTCPSLMQREERLNFGASR